MVAYQTAQKLADEWLSLLSSVEWADAAANIRDRHHFPCGETTSVEESGRLFDVSDSWAWLEKEGGDIRLTIEVFLDPDQPPLAVKTRFFTATQPDPAQ